MKTEYLELLFQHKFAMQRDIEKKSLINVFPDSTSNYVHKAELELMQKQLNDLQKLIDGYTLHHLSA